MIKLKIEKYVANPDYDQDKKESRMYGLTQLEQPQKYIRHESLNVEITEKQFEAIRKEVIKSF